VEHHRGYRRRFFSACSPGFVPLRGSGRKDHRRGHRAGQAVRPSMCQSRAPSLDRRASARRLNRARSSKASSASCSRQMSIQLMEQRRCSTFNSSRIRLLRQMERARRARAIASECIQTLGLFESLITLVSSRPRSCCRARARPTLAVAWSRFSVETPLRVASTSVPNAGRPSGRADYRGYDVAGGNERRRKCSVSAARPGHRPFQALSDQFYEVSRRLGSARW